MIYRLSAALLLALAATLLAPDLASARTRHASGLQSHHGMQTHRLFGSHRTHRASPASTRTSRHGARFARRAGFGSSWGASVDPNGAEVTAARQISARQAGGYAGGNVSGMGSDVVSEARRWLGTNPTGRSRLWCARFMNFVLQRSGHQGTGSDMARSFASLGHRVSGPQVGAIAVMSRGGGGHVGVVSGIDASGNPIVISGNHGHRVAESVYSRGRIFAYVMP